MIDEREALKLLEAIHHLARLGYPYDRDSSPIGTDIVLALDQIAGIAIRTIVEHGSREIIRQRQHRDRDRTIHD